MDPSPFKISTKSILENFRTSSVFSQPNAHNETKTSLGSQAKPSRENIGEIKEYCPSVFRELRKIDEVTAEVIS